MEKLIEQIRLKADACGDATKEQRARKGAYVDCLVMMKEASINQLNIRPPEIAENNPLVCAPTNTRHG